jgi:hypothetical protein
MTDEEKPKGRKKKPIEPESEDSVLATAAKAIGSAAGKIASLAGVAEPAPHKKAKQPKLQKKNRSRLPRRQKKARQKVAPAQAEV